MHDLPWIIFGTMPVRKRVIRLQRARQWHAYRLTEAEAQVVALRASLALIDDALADYGAESCMLGGKHGGRGG